MGDNVERALEETVPLMRLAQKARLLSRQEAEEVVRRRRDHEYRLQSRDAEQSAFLEYASFERELAALFKKRAKRRKLKPIKYESLVGKTCARANLVYSRAVRRFAGDVQLWLLYAKHCIDTNANKKAAQIFARAIALRPDSHKIWLAAIAFHFDTCGDVSVARTLAQRALRALPQTRVIWIEYFRMEIAFLAKMIARRLTIGLDPGISSKSATHSNKQNVQSENEQEAPENRDETGETPVEEASAPEETHPDPMADAPVTSLSFWQGGVPLAVFHQASRTLSLPVYALLPYWKIAVEISYTPPELLHAISVHIRDAAGSTAAVAKVLAARSSYDTARLKWYRLFPPTTTAEKGEEIEQEVSKEVLEKREKAMEELRNTAEHCGKVLVVSMKEFIERARKKEVNDAVGIVRRFVNDTESILDSELRESLKDELAAFVRRQQKGAFAEDVENQPKVQDVVADGSPEAWGNLLLAKDRQCSNASRSEISEAVRNSVCKPLRTAEMDKVAVMWLRWENTEEELMGALDALLEIPPLSKVVLEGAIAALEAFLENSEPECREKLIQKLRLVYTKITALKTAKADPDVWVNYADFERRIAGNSQEATKVSWTANRVLSKKNSQLFTEKMCLRSLRG